MNEPEFVIDDIGKLEALHGSVLDLCLLVEEAAGEPQPPEALLKLADSIPSLLGAVHDLEERLFFPDFDRHAGSCFGAMAIERLKAEHRYDLLAANELSLTLKAVADDRCGLSPDTVSRMLRGFQENLRRHILSEEILLEVLLSAKSEDCAVSELKLPHAI